MAPLRPWLGFPCPSQGRAMPAPHVAATVAAERRRRLTCETNAELITLGSELAALPDAEGKGLRHQQTALDAHHAAAVSQGDHRS